MQVFKDARKVKLEPWVLNNQLQFLILVLQLNWTSGIEEALSHAGSPLGALQHLRESTNIAQLQPLLRMAAGHLSALNRHKVFKIALHLCARRLLCSTFLCIHGATVYTRCILLK